MHNLHLSLPILGLCLYVAPFLCLQDSAQADEARKKHLVDIYIMRSIGMRVTEGRA